VLLLLVAPVVANFGGKPWYVQAFFVAFALAPGDDAGRLSGAPKGCLATVTRPKPAEAAGQKNLSESFFEALTAASAYGAQFANRVIVACP